MIIAVDANEANVENLVGVSVYTFELLSYFHKHATKDVQFVFYLKSPPRAHMPKATAHVTYLVVKPQKMWLGLALPIHFFLHRNPPFDVFFSPAHYTPRLCPAPIVTTIHDLAYEFFPQEFLKQDLYKLQHWTRESCTRSQKLIAVSENTKKDLEEKYNVDSNRIVTIHNGFTPNTQSHKDVDSPMHDSPYLLYVGTLQPRKNIVRLIEAFSLVKKRHSNLKLVLVGKKGWLFESIEKAIAESEFSSDIHVTGFVTDVEKQQLFRKASCFVMPSLYEGFNIPLLEAQSARCPVAASNTSCIPEVAGDACVYFDPSSPTEIAKAIYSVLDNDQLRAQLVKKGEENIARFSWEQAGSLTLQLLIETAKTHKDVP